MQISNPKDTDKNLIYSLYNTSLNDDIESIDYFFSEKYKPDNFLIFKKSDMVMCALEYSGQVLYLNGHNIEVKFIEKVVFSFSAPIKMREEFIDACLKLFAKSTILTIGNNKLINTVGFEDVFKRKRYKLSRSELFNVDAYSISETFDLKDIHIAHTNFAKHFDSYLIKDIFYLESYLKNLEKSNCEIYVTRNSEKRIVGYIVYNYIEGELEVIDIVYEDTLALLTLLNQAMGMNSHIYINVSHHECLERVFGSLQYELYRNNLIKINDISVFQRLFNTKSISLEDYVKSEASLLYL